MLSKYTSVLPAFAVLLAILSSGRGRREFKRPPIWIGAIMAFVVFSPVIYWNAKHEWASFKFQLNHGLENNEAVNSLVATAPPVLFKDHPGDWLIKHSRSALVYLGGQMGIYLPIFFIFGVVVLIIRLKEFSSLSMRLRILTLSTAVPLGLFLLTAFKSGYPGEANWPTFAYLPMSLLTIENIARRRKPFDIKWLRIGTVVGLLVVVLVSFPQPLAYLLKEKFPNKLNDFFGWDKVANNVQLMGMTDFPGTLIVAERHQDAGELSFYMHGQPDVWVLPIRDEHGNRVIRKTAYEYFEQPDFSKYPRIIFYSAGHTADFCRTHGYVTDGAPGHIMIFLNHRIRDGRVDVCLRIKP